MNKEIELSNLNPKQYGESEKDLQMEIDLVQGNSRKRLLTVPMIKNCLSELEARFVLPEELWDGTDVIIDCYATDLPDTYYNKDAKSTQFRAEHRNGNWVITDIFREHVVSERMRRCIYFPKDAEIELMARHCWSIEDKDLIACPQT